MQVTHIISGLKNGGAEAILFRLITADTSNEHTVVVMMDDGHYGSRIRDHGIDVVALGMPPGKLTLAAMVKLWRRLRRTRPDVVQTWMYHADLAGGIVARLAGIKAIVWGIHHTTLDPLRTPRTIRLLARACAIVSRVVPSHIISCSDEGVAVHRSLGYQAAKLITVNNGYDVDQYSPSTASRERVRAASAIHPKTVLLGMVGRWHEQKDHETLLLALEHLDIGLDPAADTRPAWHCLLVGPGIDDDNETLTTSVGKKGLGRHVQLTGPTDDVPGLMNALDIHVLSSAFGEAFPNVIAEAMACGTPCVTTDVGDAAMMVDSTGWTVPPSNPEALRHALERAIDAAGEPTSWAERKSAAVARVADHFSLPRMVAGYIRVWNRAVGGN